MKHALLPANHPLSQVRQAGSSVLDQQAEEKATFALPVHKGKDMMPAFHCHHRLCVGLGSR
jgi:hypothetical protein